VFSGRSESAGHARCRVGVSYELDSRPLIPPARTQAVLSMLVSIKLRSSRQLAARPDAAEAAGYRTNPHDARTIPVRAVMVSSGMSEGDVRARVQCSDEASAVVRRRGRSIEMSESDPSEYLEFTHRGGLRRSTVADAWPRHCFPDPALGSSGQQAEPAELIY